MGDDKLDPLENIVSDFSYPVKKAIDGASSFIGKICMPAAEEAGLLLYDEVHAFRGKNLVSIVEKSKGILTFDPDTFKLKASPRVIWKIVENGSWTEDENLQNLWAGLLASSCTNNGKDESNLIYTDLLSRITPSEAYIINYLGKKCSESKGLLNGCFHTLINFNDELFKECLYFENLDKLKCLDHLGRELNHLESLGLIENVEIVHNHQFVGMSTTGLLLDLYVRCSGSLLSTEKYFAQFWESNLNKF
ncbi:Abi-alpha family protein [Methanosarcina flavescens]|uniref:DUF4393 domain-containing protein n=1 Tax=Methanosarcina flavescens TaxID=1715806 RepID=A0A660HQH5_9EURY|nr:Abi-alpha family protein [Methanosarcina flavescens]AYK14504.1 DUF4393 domain-containing protein [Methanosarcina flavescens]